MEIDFDKLPRTEEISEIEFVPELGKNINKKGPLGADGNRGRNLR
jgi:hypothetical protein